MTSQANAQTCQDSIAKTAPDSRYQVLGNGSEIKDTQTGLIWQRCSLGQTWNGTTCSGTASQHNWSQALSQANSLGKGYRLPNIKELQSLVEEACYNPAINNKLFPNTSSGYWSTSPNANASSLAWIVNFSNGNANNDTKNYTYHVRGVRSAP